MANSYIMIDVNDERASAVAEVLNNKTCKRILQLIADKEMSEGDIASELKIPANTANYNVKKLVQAGLIEPAKGFFWSVKGRKIVTYKLSNKKILISPRPMLKGIIPAVIISGILTIGVKIFFGSNAAPAYVVTNEVAKRAADTGVMLAAPSVASSTAGAAGAAGVASAAQQTAVIAGTTPEPWAWFLLGAWVALLIFVLISMRRSSC